MVRFVAFFKVKEVTPVLRAVQQSGIIILKRLVKNGDKTFHNLLALAEILGYSARATTRYPHQTQADKFTTYTFPNHVRK
ncbi:hypothetical protein GCM10027275_14110 [Rhabdobacter roseus]